ncbi:hypothetical protein P879_07853 [Paragonimus westermani]|uniref:Uncharacterized protein n=1 Tax=Paragonimus westermani TaxID=34504 RepID=A0A8T0DHD2_9TREM|nr:hypothetical protein P879_07853 [Paragonimus westermani]
MDNLTITQYICEATDMSSGPRLTGASTRKHSRFPFALGYLYGISNRGVDMTRPSAQMRSIANDEVGHCG